MHRDAVERLFALGVVNGRPATDGRIVFDPGTATTRGQFAALLHGLPMCTSQGTTTLDEVVRRVLDDPPAW